MSRPQSPTPPTTLRDPAIFAALEEAVGGDARKLFELLPWKSGLPGPKPNYPLAQAVAEQIAAFGRKGNKLVRALCDLDPDHAPAEHSRVFLPICGVFSLAARWKANLDRPGAMARLQALAEDERRPVREAVVHALRSMIGAADESFFEALSAWMDGYLQAATVLDALSERHVLDGMKEPERVLGFLDRAFALAESAPRAHQRTQGYRVLVRVLGEAPASILNRFPDEVAEWLAERATTKSRDLREAVERGIERARKAGHGEARFEEVARALEKSAPPRRDPLTYVGPTRGRGRKRRGK